MKQTQRHLEILDVLTRQGFVSTDDLVTHFDVSPQTIRRDLNDLAEQNKIRRHHGGASLHSSTVNTAYSARKVMQLKEKERIAREVAANIPDGSSLFIDIGTTTEAIARALLNHRNLKIITNNLHVAATLSAKEDFEVLVAGGTVRSDGGIVGQAAVDFIQQFRVDFALVGISGIDEDGSLLDFDYQEVRVSQAIIDNARQVFLAADSSKFGRNAVVRLGPISLVNRVISDSPPPAAIARLMAQHKVHLDLV